jgi:hypothetical protein
VWEGKAGDYNPEALATQSQSQGTWLPGGTLQKFEKAGKKQRIPLRWAKYCTKIQSVHI